MQGWGPPGTGLLPDEARRTGPWQLLRRLGSGGMGVVYLGVRGPAELAAVKLIRPEYVANSLLRARFRREVEAARQVRGRHVARVLDADPDAPMPYLATEYIPGESLAEGIRLRGPMPEAHCRMLAAGLTEALAEIHAAGVVHRDVKPQNVLLAPEGPKLIDFGIVSVADSVTLTDTGKMIGTLGFMAPEQLYGHVATPATDVFGWGVTIAYAARGSSPFGPGPDLVRVDRIRAGERDLEGVPASLAGLVWAALEPGPAARPSVADLRAALTTARARRGEPGPRVGDRPEDHAKRHRRAVVCATRRADVDPARAPAHDRPAAGVAVAGRPDDCAGPSPCRWPPPRPRPRWSLPC